jgi:hypothetical protein
MRRYRQTALPPEYTRTSGKPGIDAGIGDLTVTGRGAGSSNSGTGNSGTNGAMSFSSNVVTVTLEANENFQLLNGNPKRKYLSITAVFTDITVAFGRAISQSSSSQEYTLLATNTMTFDSDNAPTSSVNIGSGDPTNTVTITVSTLEGVEA